VVHSDHAPATTGAFHAPLGDSHLPILRSACNEEILIDLARDDLRPPTEGVTDAGVQDLQQALSKARIARCPEMHAEPRKTRSFVALALVAA
jgi:hypothetical protein